MSFHLLLLLMSLLMHQLMKPQMSQSNKLDDCKEKLSTEMEKWVARYQIMDLVPIQPGSTSENGLYQTDFV
jgi:hypothetical protein